MKKVSVPTYFVLFLLCGITLWYFGHHRPAQKILKAEPKKVYGTKLSDSPNVVQTEQESVADASEQESREVEKSAKAKNLSNPLPLKPNPEKVDTAQHGNSISEKPEQEKTPSPGEVKAFEAFLIAETEYIEEKEQFKKALISGDTDTLEAATFSMRNARIQRNEALRNLADTSEEASKLLAEIEVHEKEVEKEAARLIADIESNEFEPKPRPVPELGFDKEEFRKLFNAMPLKEQRSLLERFPSLKNLLQAE